MLCSASELVGGFSERTCGMIKLRWGIHIAWERARFGSSGQSTSFAVLARPNTVCALRFGAQSVRKGARFCVDGRSVWLRRRRFEHDVSIICVHLSTSMRINKYVHIKHSYIFDLVK